MSYFLEFLTAAETTQLLKLLIILGCCFPFGILAGNSAVVVFNRIPASWLCDYNEKPSEELLSRDTQRIKSVPWKAFFSMFFVLAAIKMAIVDCQYAIATLIALWLLLIISIADWKYMIIPDQFVILLAITAFGFIPFQQSILSPLWGALIGAGCILLVGIAGKLLFKKEALGFGDVKLLATVGLMTGPYGIVLILIGSSFFSCAVYCIGILRGTMKRADVQPLGPYIALATALYFLLEVKSFFPGTF